MSSRAHTNVSFESLLRFQKILQPPKVIVAQIESRVLESALSHINQFQWNFSGKFRFKCRGASQKKRRMMKFSVRWIAHARCACSFPFGYFTESLHVWLPAICVKINKGDLVLASVDRTRSPWNVAVTLTDRLWIGVVAAFRVLITTLEFQTGNVHAQWLPVLGFVGENVFTPYAIPTNKNKEI